MKKTLSIHLGRQLFIIEEDAYNRLQDYLRKLELSLEKEEGVSEIVEDIEMRFAELLLHFLGTNRQVVTISDIEQGISSLGEPEEITEESENTQPFNEKDQAIPKDAPKRLFRDMDNGMISGLAAGLAAYLHIDPVIVRVFFVIFLFMGFGVPVYLLLWFIIPNANTPSERLQMQGKPVNIDTLKEEFEKGANRFKEEAKVAGNKIKYSATHASRQFNSFFRTIGKMIGLFLVVSSIIWIVTFSLIITGFIDVIPMTGDDSYASIFEFLTLIVPSGKSMLMIWLSTLIIGYACPLLAIAVGVKLILGNVNRFYKINFIVFPSLIFIGIFLGIIGSIQTARDYEVNSEIENQHLIINTDQLELQELPLIINNRRVTSLRGIDFISIKNNQITEDGIHLRYKESKDSLFHISQKFSAHGIDLTAAQIRCAGIKHNMVLEGNKLLIDPYYTFPVKDGLRNQEIEIVIEVPRDKKLFINDLETIIGGREYGGVLYPNKPFRSYED